MSILKSTCSGKHMPLTVEYLLKHGWYHPWMFSWGGASNVNHNTLVRELDKHGELEIIRKKDGSVTFRCTEYYKLQENHDGPYDDYYMYKYEYQPRTVNDLELMIALWDEPKPNKRANMRSELYFKEFVHAEVVRK